MTVTVIRTCSVCGVSDEVRKVKTYHITVYRDNVYIGAAADFELCGVCMDTKLDLMFSTVHSSMKFKRSYHKGGKEEETVFQRANGVKA